MRIDPDSCIVSFMEYNTSTTESHEPLPFYHKGDIIQGTVLEILENEILLQLNSGQKMKAYIDNLLNAQIGEKLYFQICSLANNQIVLKPLQQESSNTTKYNFILQVLERANIVSSQKNIQIVETLLDYQLPIDRNHIQKALFYTHITEQPKIEHFLFFIKNNIPFTKENIVGFQNYIITKIPLGNELETLFQKITQNTDLSLKENLRFEWIQYQQQQRQNIISIFEKYIQQYNLSEKIGSEKITLENVSLSTLISKCQLVKDTPIIKLLQKDENLMLFYELLKETKENSKLVRDFLRTPKKEYNLEWYNHPPIKPKDLIQPNKLQNYYQELYQKISILEKGFLKIENQGLGSLEPNLENIKTELQHFRQGIEFLNTFNHYEHYFLIPLQFINDISTGELYLFRNKKKEKGKKQIVTALLSLDLKTLGSIDIFIQKNIDQVYCEFKIKNKDIEPLLKEKMNILQQALYHKGYILQGKVSIVNKDSSSVIELINKQNIQEKSIENNNPYSFDKKV